MLQKACWDEAFLFNSMNRFDIEFYNGLIKDIVKYTGIVKESQNLKEANEKMDDLLSRVQRKIDAMVEDRIWRMLPSNCLYLCPCSAVPLEVHGREFIHATENYGICANAHSEGQETRDHRKRAACPEEILEMDRQSDRGDTAQETEECRDRGTAGFRHQGSSSFTLTAYPNLLRKHSSVR